MSRTWFLSTNCRYRAAPLTCLSGDLADGKKGPVMVKGLLRFGLVWALTMLVTPHLERALGRLVDKVPKDSFVEDFLKELNGRYSASLIRSFGETVGELVLGQKK